MKNLTDAGSSWVSYGFVGLAGAVSVGTYLDWAAARRTDSPVLAAQAPRDQLSRLTRSDAVLARPVVVLDDPLDLEPQRLVERDRPLVHG